MSIGIVNIGVGNLGSIENTLLKHGFDVSVESDPENLKKHRRVILPGVGAFGAFMQGLRTQGFEGAIKEYVQTPENKLIGICVGMQVLFERGSEGGEHKGLGFFAGSVDALSVGQNGRVPNVGWSYVSLQGDLESFSGDYYFTHSFANQGSDGCVGTISHNETVTVCVARNNIVGFQFHPEKSGKSGVDLLTKVCF